MSRCRSCGSPLLKRSQKIFCSNICQAEDRRRTGTQRWLESGEAWIDGRRGHYVRQYLATAQSGRCAICSGPSTWLDRPLAMIIDHIDGNPSNNRRENLRLNCPNCDSRLPTYKSRNRGSGRHYRRQRYAEGRSF
ncbi:HNH endonuclease [Mycolicibacterium sp. BiH015]|uniref:HNH endonuclease n=1 Tax=Mycolicibacterium sp. BiH015 TaxID=3018808 RepID=UPI0022E7CB6E|nr:HNH endonuclease [Mycolicibacterium sp. BiH015]MDA2889566.1 HNH endonuclease [Mycolicibacterium sp. BiH015]